MRIDNSFSALGQIQAINWLYEYLKNPQKASEVRVGRIGKPVSNGREHSRALRLQVGAIRNLQLLRHILQNLCRKKVRVRLESLLLLGLFELMEEQQKENPRTPAVVHSWVETGKVVFSKQESRFINAILRKGSTELEQILTGNSTLPPAIRYSHPDWLVARWVEAWGEKDTLSFLKWNQGTPGIYLRAHPDYKENLPPELEETQWDHFYQHRGSFSPETRKLLEEGFLTVQDPATRFAVEALAGRPVSSVLELCASPGGKTRYLDTLLPKRVSLTAVDLPHRITLLKENLSYCERPISLIETDLLNPDSDRQNWQNRFDAVLLDAPCSNTGVLQRKPDVKWRLQPEDLTRLTAMQAKLLENASHWVAPGGYLVYSTCSVEAEENQNQTTAFLQTTGGQLFSLISSTVVFPHQAGHDGAGVAVLQKSTN